MGAIIVVLILAVVVVARDDEGSVPVGSQATQESFVADEAADGETACIDAIASAQAGEDVVQHLQNSAAASEEFDVVTVATETYAAAVDARAAADAASADPAISGPMYLAADEWEAAGDDQMASAQALAAGDMAGATAYIQDATAHVQAASGYLEASTAAAESTDVPACSP